MNSRPSTRNLAAQISLDEKLNRLGIGLQGVQRGLGLFGIRGRIQRFCRFRGIGQRKGANPARGTLDGMIDGVPALFVAGLQQHLQPGHQFIGLGIEELQYFRIERGITARITGEVGHIDRTMLRPHGHIEPHISITGMVTQIDQEGVNAIAAAVEPCAIAAWPARATLEMGGWLLRFTDGFSHRGNSVAARGFEGADLQAQIALTEIAYFSRGLEPLFQITPLTQPADLEATLIERGYLCDTPTNVMIADTASVKHETSNVTLDKEPDESFKVLVISGSHSAADGRERLDVLSRIAVPHIFASIGENGNVVACGMCTVTNGWGGINLMRTDLSHRRRGHAAQVLAALASWADGQGAARLYLQVEDGNAPAQALYAKAGFADAYSYRFYRAS